MKRGFRHKIYLTTMEGSRGLVRRRLVSWVGLILLVFNIFGAGSLPVRAEGTGTPLFAQELLGDRIVVCTAAGMVVMDRDGNIINTGPTSSSHGDLCVYCLPLMHGAAQAPASMALAADAVFAGEEKYLPAEPAAAVPTRLPGAASPRAPPQA